MIKLSLKNIEYRKDKRSLEQFKKDIIHSTIRERAILNRVLKPIYDQTGIPLIIEDNGVDNTGEFTEEATTDADFKVGRLIDVKYEDPNMQRFHLKVNQVQSYLKQNAVILFVMGFDTKTPKYTWIEPKDIINNETEIFWQKKCYILRKRDYKWRDY